MPPIHNAEQTPVTLATQAVGHMLLDSVLLQKTAVVALNVYYSNILFAGKRTGKVSVSQQPSRLEEMQQKIHY